jgi:hypothetical protein
MSSTGINPKRVFLALRADTYPASFQSFTERILHRTGVIELAAHSRDGEANIAATGKVFLPGQLRTTNSQRMKALSFSRSQRLQDPVCTAEMEVGTHPRIGRTLEVHNPWFPARLSDPTAQGPELR